MKQRDVHFYRRCFYASLRVVSGFFLHRKNSCGQTAFSRMHSVSALKRKIKNSVCLYSFPFGVINSTWIATGWFAILVECYSSHPWLSPTGLLGGDQWAIYLKDRRTNGWFILIPAGHLFPQAIMKSLQPRRQQPLFLLQAGILIETGTLRAIGSFEGKQWAPQAVW